jgi:phage shock protein C
VNSRRLYRSNDDRMVAGVCGGVADYFDVDPVIVRIIWFLSFFFTGSLTFWAYIVMAIVVPIEPETWPQPSPWQPGGAPIGHGGLDAAPGTVPPAGDPAAPGFAATTDATGTGASTPAGTAPGAGAGSWQAGAPGGSWSADWRSQRRAERWERRHERWEHRMEHRANRDRTPGLVFGLLLVLVGGMLAWHQFDPRFDLGLTWPVAVIALGAILVVSAIRPGGRKDGQG